MNELAAQDSLFFFLSKVFWAVLSPMNLIILAFGLGVILLLLHRVDGARRVLIPTAIISFILMIYPVSDFLMKPLESRFPALESLPSDVDAIIILGGGEDLPRSLSWDVAELGSAGDRYIGAADLANLYGEIPVLFTGGSGQIRVQESKGEDSIARKILTSVGIDDERLIIESNSRNTYENFKYSKKLLPKYYKGQARGTYLLVTSAYHMPRAVGIARKQGIDVIPYPVDYYSNSDEMRYFGLDMHQNMKALERAWKEWIGLAAYYMTDKTDSWFPAPEEPTQQEQTESKTTESIDTSDSALEENSETENSN